DAHGRRPPRAPLRPLEEDGLARETAPRPGRGAARGAARRGRAAHATAGERRGVTKAILRFNGRAFVSVKKHRNYRLFFLGQAVSLPGTWIQRFAQAWLVYSLTHNSAFAVGLLAFTQFLPFTLFSLLAGVVADRFDPRRTVLLTQASHMTLAAIMAATT